MLEVVKSFGSSGRKIFNNAAKVSKPFINSIIPVAARLAKTNRHEVERLKRETERLEEDFKNARQTLLQATKSLDDIKAELRELYLRREFEYRKVKSDVQVIREINEIENNLMEKEERHQLAVDNLTKTEQDLFDKTRTSHQFLYNSTRDYAMRYIALGITLGTLVSVWKGYQYVGTLTHQATPSTDMPLFDGSSPDDIINNVKVQANSIADKLTQEMRTENINLKNEIIEAIQKAGTISNEKEPMSNDKHIDTVLLSDTAMIVVVSLAAGIVGGSLSLLISRYY